MNDFVEGISEFCGKFVGIVWGAGIGGFPFLVIGLILAGLYFTIQFRFPQFRLMKHSIDVIRGKFDRKEDKGEITHFQALCAALSATIGLGNIAGVAVAISAGGPGAVFWMWVAALVGTTTKFTSISLALLFREVDQDGMAHGGPMYTIKNGLGKAFTPLAIMYAIFTMLSALGAGNMFQSNQVASLLETNFQISPLLTGVIFCVMAGLVLVGGIKRIGNVSAKIVPLMVVIYFGAALGILAVNIEQVPALFLSIFNDAFSGTAAVGGFGGVAVKEVIAQGVRRAVFSNEAGMGSAAMAHAAAKSKEVQEGIVGMIGPYIDTIVVCTVTALVLLSTGAWHTTNGLEGADLTAQAFSSVYGPLGSYLVVMTVIFFAFSTIISWSYYGEKGVTYLFGRKWITPYRYVFIVFILIGAVLKLQPVLDFSDAVFGLLAIPNLIANFMLTGKLKVELRKYESDLKAGKI